MSSRRVREFVFTVICVVVACCCFVALIRLDNATNSGQMTEQEYQRYRLEQVPSPWTHETP